MKIEKIEMGIVIGSGTDLSSGIEVRFLNVLIKGDYGYNTKCKTVRVITSPDLQEEFDQAFENIQYDNWSSVVACTPINRSYVIKYKDKITKEEKSIDMVYYSLTQIELLTPVI